MTMRPWMRYAQIAAPLLGIPVLVYWAVGEQAMALDDTLSAGFAAGLALYFSAFMVLAWRFVLILRVMDIEFAYVPSLRINLLGMFYYFFVPFAVGADLTRFVKLKARSHGALQVAAAIVLDHVVGLSALIVISVSLFAWQPPLEISADGVKILAVIAAMSLLAGLGFIHYRDSLRARYAEVREQIRERAGLVAAATALSVAMHIVIGAAVWIGSLEWQFGLSFVQILFTVATAQMFQAIPVNLGGIGASEVTATTLYVALGLPLSAAILMVSLTYVYRLAMAVVGGLWDLLPEQPAVGAS